MVADDALMEQCATAHCACKMAAMLTRETSELIGPDLRPPNRMSFRTSAVTVFLYYFTYLHKLDLKLRFLHILCTGWAKKTGPFLRVSNFARVSDRKACYTPKVCKFCLEDSVKVSCQCIRYSLLNLHKYSLSLKL